MAAVTAQTASLVEQWLRLDTNEQTRQEIRQLVNEGNESKLQDLLGKRLEFGQCFLHSRVP